VPSEPKKDPIPSETFEEAFRDNTGTIWDTCELCGVTIFTDGSPSNYNEGELEELERKAKENPEKYIQWNYDGVSLGRIDGRKFIMGHECPALGKYEAFIWRYRFQIAEYLQKRAKEELDEKT
jgi:hypothetical protein